MSETSELEAFCAICPTEQDVTRVLQRLGFRLIFQMDAITSPPSSYTPALPAQFHFENAHGTQVIYLAGQDTDLDDRRLPSHASRRWLSPGGYPVVAKQVAQALASTWSLTWRASSSESELRQSA
jgi:hypothetical protein